MPSFFPSDPHDAFRTRAEMQDWKESEIERKAQKKRDTIRFIINAVLSGIAALAAVAGVDNSTCFNAMRVSSLSEISFNPKRASFVCPFISMLSKTSLFRYSA